MKRPTLNPVVQSVGGIVVVMVGVGAVWWCWDGGHMFGGFLSLALMLGALVPLYPPEANDDMG